MTNLALGWEALPGKFLLTVSVPMTATIPQFRAKIQDDGHGYAVVSAHSFDINVTVDEVKVFDLAMHLLDDWTDDVELNKGDTHFWYTSFTPNPVQMYYVWILFKTENTFMVRKWETDGEGQGTRLIGSLN